MGIYTNIDKLPQKWSTAITIGTFDGVHAGHKEILTRLKEIAQQNNLRSVVITFNPHPRSIVQVQNEKIKLLSSLEEKVQLLLQTGIDDIVIVPFTQEFANQSPENYVEDFLMKQFSPKYIIIGYDHHFGYQRAGNIQLLKEYEKNGQFKVIEIEKQLVDEIAVSSTKIRNALAAGEIEKANHLLGRAFELHGIVTKGQQIGRQLGFPTANLYMNDQAKIAPKNGVYAVKVHIEGKMYFGMMNIGTRPTFENDGLTYEVHVLKLDEDIYNKKVGVNFVKRIRDERKFATADELILQLKKDEEAVKNLFGL